VKAPVIKRKASDDGNVPKNKKRNIVKSKSQKKNHWK